MRKTRGALAIALACVALPACYVPVRVRAPDRAISIYREARSRRAEPQKSAVAPRTLSVDQAVEMAVQGSARVAAANAKTKTAGALAVEAGQPENPTLRIQNIRLDQVLDNETRVDVSLRVSPARPGELDAEVAMARAEESEAHAEALLEQHEVEAEVRWAFYDVLLLDAEVEATQAAANARRKLSSTIKASMDQGRATRADDAFADLAATEAEQESAELRANRAVAFGTLMNAIGLPENAPVRLTGDPLDPALLPELPGEEATVEEALKNRPEVGVAAAQIDAAHASAYLEQAKRWPWFSFLEVGYQFAPRIPKGLGWTFGAAIEVPIFTTNRAGVLRAEAERTEAQRGLSAEVDRIAREVRACWREARAARNLVRTFADVASPAADRAASEVKTALDAGQVDMLRMVLIEQKRIAMSLQRLKLLRRYYLAITELRTAVGGKLPTPAASAPPKR